MSYDFYQPPLTPGLQVVIQPYAEPVSLAEVKLHLKRDDITADDATIASLITAARDHVETQTGRNVPRNRVCMATTFDYFLDGFPCGDFIQLPRTPLITAAVYYVDNDGTTQTMDTTDYVVDTATGRIHLAYNESWPAVRYQRKSVTVRFVAGMAATFTASSATITAKGRTFVAGDRVRIMSAGGGMPGGGAVLGKLPAGLSVLTDYFVVPVVSGFTFGLAATSGGTAISVTDGGTDTHYISQDLTSFETARNAIKLMVTHLYRNRSAVVVGTIAVQIPMSIDALISAIQA